MLKLLTLFLCIYGGLTAPTVLESRPLVRNTEKQVETFLPGVENLGEKSLPAAKIHPTLSIDLPGTRNLAERIQIEPQNSLPGTRNLAEKAIPQSVVLKMSVDQAISEQWND